MQSKITLGEVPITLDGDEIVLRPTMRAMTQISRTYGGLAKARTEIAQENIDAIAYVIRVGAGMNDRDAKDLGDRIFATGTADMIVPLIRYVAILGNGGKPLEGDDEVDDADAGGSRRSRKRDADPLGSN